VLVLIGLVFAVGVTGERYLLVSFEVRPLPVTDLAEWLSGWVFLLFAPVLMYLAAVYPSGRVASRWLRWPLRAGIALTAVMAASRMVLPVPVATDVRRGLTNPWTIEALAPLMAADVPLGYATTALLLVPVIDLVARWRRSEAPERLQMRWLSLALVVFGGLVLASLALRLTRLPAEVIEMGDAFAWLTGLGMLPIAIGVAVTRYRLFDIDRLLSRTLSYALIVGGLSGVYAGGVLLLRGLFPLQGQLAVAISTLAVATLFTPVRRRVQARMERRFNRSRYDTARTIEAFGARLRDRLDLEDVTRDLLGLVAATMQPSTANVWLPEGRRGFQNEGKGVTLPGMPDTHGSGPAALRARAAVQGGDR
jgi:hypothetical protein